MRTGRIFRRTALEQTIRPLLKVKSQEFKICAGETPALSVPESLCGTTVL